MAQAHVFFNHNILLRSTPNITIPQILHPGHSRIGVVWRVPQNLLRSGVSRHSPLGDAGARRCFLLVRKSPRHAGRAGRGPATRLSPAVATPPTRRAQSPRSKQAGGAEEWPPAPPYPGGHQQAMAVRFSFSAAFPSRTAPLLRCPPTGGGIVDVLQALWMSTRVVGERREVGEQAAFTACERMFPEPPASPSSRPGARFVCSVVWEGLPSMISRLPMCQIGCRRIGLLLCNCGIARPCRLAWPSRPWWQTPEKRLFRNPRSSMECPSQ